MSKAPLTTAQARTAWGPACATSRTTVRFFTGVQVTIDPRVVPAFAALDQALERHGYRPRPGVTGAYVCRRITGGTGYSLHAYGTAVDINWDTNPYTTGRLVTDMPSAMVAEITGMRTNSGAPVWGWGGAYRSIKDAMHYEIVCSPDDLATGIKGGTATLTDDQKALIFLSAKAHAAKLPELGKGHLRKPRRRSVAKLQQLLGLRQTGVYGPGVRRRVRALQGFLGLPVTGLVDAETWAWVIYAALTKGR